MATDESWMDISRGEALKGRRLEIMAITVGFGRLQLPCESSFPPFHNIFGKISICY